MSVEADEQLTVDASRRSTIALAVDDVRTGGARREDT